MGEPGLGSGQEAFEGGGRKEPLVLGVILALTLLLYLPTIKFEFVYDDVGRIVQNPFVQSWHYFPKYFTTHVWKNLYPLDPGNYYRPFFLLWLLLNYSVFGLSPAGWHVSTVLLHLGTTALTYFVVRKVTADRLSAGVCALLFGVHPIHLEVVAWVSGATESLFSVFFLAAFLAYLHARERRSPSAWAIALALYGTALLSKETAIVFPVFVLAHAWLYGPEAAGKPSSQWGRRLRGASMAAAPFLLLAGLYLGVRFVVLKGLGHAVVNLRPSTIVLTWPSLWVSYLKLLVFPVGLSEWYDHPYVDHVDARQVLFPVLALLLVGAALWYWQHRSGSREVRFALVWICVPLLPLLNLSVFQVGDLVHDRYLYLPSLGFALLVAVALERLFSGSRRVHGYAMGAVRAALVMAAPLCVGTLVQSAPWANNLALYSHALKVAPRNETARNNLATVYAERGRYPEARALYEQVLRGMPSSWLANYNLGFLAYKTGQLAEAESYLLRAVQIDPTRPDQYVYLGMVRFRTGRLADATADVEKAIALKPTEKGYHFALGMILLQKGDCAAARPQFQAELSLDPRNKLVRRELAECDQRLHRSSP